MSLLGFLVRLGLEKRMGEIGYTKLMITFFIFFTWLGNWEQIVFVGAFCIGILIIKGLKWEGVVLFGAVALSKILEVILKQVFQRERPDPSLWLTEASGYSFPSGHAVVSSVLYGLMSYFLWKNLKTGRQRVMIVACLIIVIICIGLSRVILGVHWLSDVGGGWVIGATVIAMATLVLAKYSPKSQTKQPSRR